MRISFIKKLIELLEERNLEEIEIRRFGTTIRIRKNFQGKVKVEHPVNNPVKKLAVEEEKKAEEVKEEKTVAIKAPMVGTFYRAPAPDAPPYIEVGDKIAPGRVVCIVEAMKIMNEIESDVRGTIVDILVKNEDPVEYNQELFLVNPE
jgi:acetyl-CoA carboxylase biotin carboxyl carrier protein